MMIRSRGLVLLAPALVLLAAAAPCARAQVAPGSAVVAWKQGAAAGGLKLVDPSGAHGDITGLDPATIGTTALDGARSVLVTNTGVLFAGLGADNRTGSAPVPLVLRRILLNGAAALSDQPFATIMQVPAGQFWYVSDVEERADGTLLVAATETIFTMRPLPAKGVFLVATNGTVTPLPATGFPSGSLLAIADAGNRYVAAFYLNISFPSVELRSFGYSPSDPTFQVFQFLPAPLIAGMTLDVDGTILAGVPTGTSTIMRIPHVANATPVPVLGAPVTISVCDVIPAPGLVASVGTPMVSLPVLSLTDTLAGATGPWASGLTRDPVAVSVRGNPARYGAASAAGVAVPFLGSFGGLPARGNAGFGLRLGGSPGAAGVVMLGRGRGSVATPFGTFLLDPTRLLLPLLTVAIPNSGSTQVPLPLPADSALRGAVVDLQAILVVGAVPLAIEMSPGLEITIQ